MAQRLERAEGRANAAFVETRGRLIPESGAEWIEVAGAYAMFDGVDSPCTQTFGLGLFDEVGDPELERLENFFRERGAPVCHETSPMAGLDLVALLNARGYQPVEYSTVLCRELTGLTQAGEPSTVTTRVISPDEADLWARTSAEAWAAEEEWLGEFMLSFGRISAQCEGGHPFIADLDGEPVATGLLLIHGDVAILAGASTLPRARRRGAQGALLDARLRYAANAGCTLAMIVALPGSQSQRNAQKNGFEIAYTRVKWQLKG